MYKVYILEYSSLFEKVIDKTFCFEFELEQSQFKQVKQFTIQYFKRQVQV